MTTTDSNGLIQYQTTDNVVPLQTAFNGLSSSVSTALNATVRTFKVANDTERNALATSRPPTASNPLVVFNSTSGKGYHEINTGSGWSRLIPVPAFPDTGWVDVPCVASNSTVQARRVDDRVSLRGDLYNAGNVPISGNSITNVLGTLPAQFRAPKSQWTLCNSWVAGLPSTSPAYGRPMGLVVYQTGELLLQNPQSQAITCAELYGVNIWTN